MPISRLLASGLLSGYFPKSPGTAGTLLFVALWWVGTELLPAPLRELDFTLALLLLTTLGLLTTRLCLNELRKDSSVSADGKIDPQFIVIDEWAGMLLPLYGLSTSQPLAVVSAFALFRVFDIMKPGPVRAAEKLPGEWGVMMDDIVAGVLALLVLQGGLTLLGGGH